jgi:hypothetical protein
MLHADSNKLKKNKAWPQCSKTLGMIKRWNLRIHGLVRTETQTKARENLFSEIIAENSPNLGKDIDM